MVGDSVRRDIKGAADRVVTGHLNAKVSVVAERGQSIATDPGRRVDRATDVVAPALGATFESDPIQRQRGSVGGSTQHVRRDVANKAQINWEGVDCRDLQRHSSKPRRYRLNLAGLGGNRGLGHDVDQVPAPFAGQQQLAAVAQAIDEVEDAQVANR